MKYKKKMFIIVLFYFFVFPLKIFAIKTDVLNPKITTQKYENYYYFVEPYGKDIYEGKTIRYGIFAPQVNASNEGVFEIIPLKRKCSSSIENCKTYTEFWTEYRDIILSKNKIPYVAGVYCDISNKESKKGDITVNSYTHGCWRRDNSSTIQGGNSSFSEIESINGMACSSVSRDAKVTIEESSKSKIYEYLELKIEREPFPYIDDNNKGAFNSNKNTSNCNIEEDEFQEYLYDNYKVRSPILAKYTYTKDSYDCPKINSIKNGSCNDSSYISQQCGRKTIVGDADSQADINIEQTGVLSNVISPTKIYQGGGISIAFIYQNTFKWSFVPNTIKERNMDEEKAKESVISKIENDLIKPLETFEEELRANMDISIDGISDSYMNQIKNELQINCEREGEIEEGKTITTTCTIFMPKTELNIGTGTIGKVFGSEEDFVTNKVYTDITYSGKAHLKASFNKLNMLKVDDRNDNEWSIVVGDNDDASCDVEVEKRLYDGKNKYIYRPIDISNPFPNDRNAGVNWYEWWNKSYNKDRLKNSYNEYTSLQYKIELNPSSIKDIKDSTIIGDYYDWDEKDLNNDNDFINDYFDKIRENIIEEGDY